ncbi:MAG: glutamate--tRNA ligase [Candidatus Paceibacterota bacterium]|jgi:glutamyl-tRNA synthetase
MISLIKALFSKNPESSNAGTPGSGVVTRFAPSPTGFMHIGGARTALYAYLWARKNNGTFILRIEDTDTEREVEGSIAHIQETLKWLGINWDFGPDRKDNPFGSCIQSERLDSYRQYAQKLVDKGLAYPDPYTAEELAAFRAQADLEKRPFLYRHHRPINFGVWNGTQALRFKVAKPRRYKWHDAVRGDLEAGEEALDDFILMKKDGYPTYNFAHIIDDLLMGVTHIMRADEFISSTPKFLSLYEGLGIQPPTFVTLPPILRSDKTKKLGKRDGAKDILEYRKEGFLPDAMVNFLALVGWNPGTEREVFNPKDLIAEFDIAKIHKAGGVFNEEKLRWMNKEHLKLMPIEGVRADIKARIESNERASDLKWNLTPEIVKTITPVILDRIEVYADIDTMIAERDLDYYFSEPSYDALSLKWKDEPDLTNTIKHLKHIRGIMADIPDSRWNEADIKEAAWPYADANGRGAVLWPLRYALSGKDKSPNPFTLSAILGKETVLRRIDVALKKCADHAPLA